MRKQDQREMQFLTTFLLVQKIGDQKFDFKSIGKLDLQTGPTDWTNPKRTQRSDQPRPTHQNFGPIWTFELPVKISIQDHALER